MCRASRGAELPLATTSTPERPAGLGGRTGRKGWKEGVGGLRGRAGSPPEPGHPCSPREEARTCSQGCQRWSTAPSCLHVQQAGTIHPCSALPRSALNHTHDLKGVCLLEKSIWPLLRSRKSNNLYLTRDSVVWQQQLSLPASPPPTRNTE